MWQWSLNTVLELVCTCVSRCLRLKNLKVDSQMLLTCLHFAISNSLPFQTGDCGRYPWATGWRAQMLLPFSLGNWMCCQWTWRYFTSCIILDLPVLKTGRSNSVIFQQHLHVQQDGVPGWGICSTVIWSTVEVRRWKVGFFSFGTAASFHHCP